MYGYLFLKSSGIQRKYERLAERPVYHTYVFCTYMHLARALFDGIFRRELALSNRTAGLTLHFAQRELYATYVCRHGYFSTYSHVRAAHVKDYRCVWLV